MEGPELSKPIEQENLETKTKIIIKNLHDLLENFSDEIPQERIFGKSQYKVRGNWFQGVQSNLFLAIYLGLIKEESFKKEIEEFFSSFREKRKLAITEMSKGLRKDSFVATTREEINTANSFIKKALGILEIF